MRTENHRDVECIEERDQRASNVKFEYVGNGQKFAASSSNYNPAVYAPFSSRETKRHWIKYERERSQLSYDSACALSGEENLEEKQKNVESNSAASFLLHCSVARK
uniref:Uncharacterized protein n=1 Tax=Glossina pallidipes TaxID=7398 RepID=A0A1A9Z5D4_GLOPL